MWGESALGEIGTLCTAVAGGMPVLVSGAADEGETRQRVLYQTGGPGPHDPIVSAWSAVAADAPVIRAITLSGTKKPADQPKDGGR